MILSSWFRELILSIGIWGGTKRELIEELEVELEEIKDFWEGFVGEKGDVFEVIEEDVEIVGALGAKEFVELGKVEDDGEEVVDSDVGTVSKLETVLYVGVFSSLLLYNPKKKSISSSLRGSLRPLMAEVNSSLEILCGKDDEVDEESTDVEELSDESVEAELDTWEATAEAIVEILFGILLDEKDEDKTEFGFLRNSWDVLVGRELKEFLKRFFESFLTSLSLLWWIKGYRIKINKSYEKI